MALGFKDPRLNLQITDGIKWVQDIEEGTYDAIIVDSSDPVGPAEVLFQQVGGLLRPPARAESLSLAATRMSGLWTGSRNAASLHWHRGRTTDRSRVVS